VQKKQFGVKTKKRKDFGVKTNWFKKQKFWCKKIAVKKAKILV